MIGRFIASLEAACEDDESASLSALCLRGYESDKGVIVLLRQVGFPQVATG